MISIFVGICFLIISFFICWAVFPSKTYLNDIYQEIYLAQREQTRILKDLRNVFFAKNRKFKKEGK